MIREIFEKESSHGNSSPPCSVFFVLCLLVLRARIISWRVSWFPQCILGRHWTREILEPQGFLNQHRCPGPFSPFMPFLQTQIKARNQSLRVFLWGLELRLFLACVQLSPPLKLSPRSFEGRGRYTAWSSPAVSGPSVPGVQIVECGTKGEREKKIRRKRGRGLLPLPHPLFVCLFFFLLTSSLRCPQDMNSWSRIVSRARGKLTRKGEKKKNNNDKNKTTTTTTTKKGASRFIRQRLTRVGPLLWTLRSTIWTP